MLEQLHSRIVEWNIQHVYSSMQFQNYYIATKIQGSDETPYSNEEIVLKTSLVKT